MAIAPARQAAFDILLRVEERQAYSSELLHSDATAGLSPADRGLCMELVMGVLRWRSFLDTYISRLSFTPFRKLDLEVLMALRLGVYQIQFLERIPARAAINESVELVKHARKHSAAPLVNAVLHKVPKTSNTERAERHQVAFPSARDGESTTESLARDFAHPAWLLRRWQERYGDENTAAICRYDQQVPVTAVRLRDPSAENELTQQGIELRPGVLMASARRVISGDVTRTPACAEGRIAIQDEASQLVAALVGKGARILDCCAAPGGKTAAIADRNPGSELIAIDLHEHRARLLRHLLRASDVRIIIADARFLPLSSVFDRVLADVPCSGTGTLARNPEIKWRLKPEDLSDLHNRQVAILHAAVRQLAPGGRLIYSSCSLEPEENESVIEEVLAINVSVPGAEGVRVVDCREELIQLQLQGQLVWPDMGSLLSGPFLRTLPGVHPCDGFFAAILAKT